MSSLKGQNNTVKRFQTGGHSHEARRNMAGGCGLINQWI